MTRPCQNCHNAPYTGPKIADNKSYDCAVQPSLWPPSLQVAQPEKSKIDSWVRQNYQSTLTQSKPKTAPFFIDIKKADLRIDLKPHSFQVQTPWYAPGAGLRVDPEGNIHSEFEIRDNELPMLMQSLLEFNGIHFETGAGYRFCPDRISVGDHGILHLIGEVPSWFYENIAIDPSVLSFDYFLLTKLQKKHPLHFYFPSPQGFQGTFPLGRDDPAKTHQYPYSWDECCDGPVPTLEAGGFYACMTDDHPLPQCKPFEFPDAQENPKLDFGITHDVPRVLRDQSERIPNAYELNDLISQILELAKQPKTNDGSLAKFLQKLSLDDQSSPKKLLDLLKAANATLELSDLQDFFWPGIIDIGPSHGTFRLRKTAEDLISISGENIDVQIEAMDYAGVQLHHARLQSGEPYTDAQSKVWEPGIHAIYNPDTKQIETRVKFDLNAELTVPILGHIKLSTPILFETQLHQYGQWRFTPGKTQLIVPHIHIQNDNARSPLDTDLRLVISDLEQWDGTHYREVSSKTPHFNVYLGGKLGDAQDHVFEWDSYIPVAKTNNHYKALALKHDLEISGSLKIKDPKGTQSTADFTVDTFKPHAFSPRDNENDFGIRIGIDLLKGERTWEEEDEKSLYYARIGKDDPDWLLSDGRFQFTSVKLVDGHTEQSITLEAGALRLGSVFLKDVNGKAVLAQLKTDAATTRINVPKFSLSANPEGSPEGVLRGPISFELADCEAKRKNSCHLPTDSLTGSEKKSLHLEWNQDERRLRFENLNLILQVMGIVIPKGLEKQQKTYRGELFQAGSKLKRRADALGLDGRVTGYFDFNFEDWTGKGDLRILGDKNGDIYFHSKAGHRINPPLIRLTNWRFKRFDRFLFDKGYALGDFRLFTRINTRALRKFGFNINYETDVVMGHRDVMFKPGGIDAANHRYYQKLFDELLSRGGLAFLKETAE